MPVEVGGGLFGRPTVVNNVETLMCVPHVINRGAAWFAGIGTPDCPGPKVYSVSGHVNRPGIYELPMGTTLRDLIYKHAGGVQRNQKVKAVSPGALASPLLSGDELDVHLDVFSARPHSELGAGGIIVYGEEVDIVPLVLRASTFFANESCGKCVPCREGTRWIADALQRIVDGKGRQRDIDIINDVAGNMERKTLCMLGSFAAWPVQSALRKFRPDFERYLGHAPPRKQLPVLAAE
ncbi:MAG: SLBB domain-containing protein [Chloroflexi bacterium]|nr:SLBB domain-containing protein [Chloroflexota bacterium]